MGERATVQRGRRLYVVKLMGYLFRTSNGATTFSQFPAVNACQPLRASVQRFTAGIFERTKSSISAVFSGHPAVFLLFFWYKNLLHVVVAKPAYHY